MAKPENPAGDWKEYKGPERRSRTRLEGQNMGFVPRSVEMDVRQRLVNVLTNPASADGVNGKAVFSADVCEVLQGQFGNAIIRGGVMTVHEGPDDVFGESLMARNADGDWQFHDVKEGDRIVVRKGPFVTLPEVRANEADVQSKARRGNLKFEFTPSKTMAVAGFKNGKWSDADYVPAGAMEIDPLADRYGQVIFGGNRALRMRDGRVALFRPDYHAKRFNDNAKALCMPGLGEDGRLLGEDEDFDLWPEITPEELVEVYKNVAKANGDYIPPTGQGSLYLAPGMRASKNQLGVKPNDKYAFTCLGIPAGKIFGKPAAIWIESEFHRAAKGGAGGVKAAGNYAPTFQVKHQMHLLGCHDVAYLDNGNKEFRELSSSNLFFVTKDGWLVTPRLDGEILNGCTRDSILQIAQELVEEGVIKGIRQTVVSPNELPNIQEAFSSGTGVTINAIEVFKTVSLEGHLVKSKMDISDNGMGPVTRKVYDKFNRILAGDEMDNPKYQGWMVPIDEE